MKIKRKIVIGSRASPLAKVQSKLVYNIFKSLFIDLELNFIKTKGDKLSYEVFKSQGGKGLFTKEIDKLILNNILDIAVHSSKDIPYLIDNNLTIAAYLPREDVRDVLVTVDKRIKKIDQLPSKFILGTSSPRRTSFIQHLRPDIRTIPIRGNVNTRINQVLSGKVDAIILSNAGIKRLKIKNDKINISPIPIKTVLPAAGQGAIAIVCRKSDKELIKICKKIGDKKTKLELTAERAFIKRIKGDCFTPLSALAKIKNDKIIIKASIFDRKSNTFKKTEIKCPKSESKKAGIECADRLINMMRK